MHKASVIFIFSAGLLSLAFLLPRPATADWYDFRNVPVCTDAGLNHTRPTSVSDGAGGIIVTWVDSRNPGFGQQDIYAQRVSADGIPMWTANGVALCTASGNQWYPKIVSDGAGGAIVTWEDYRNGEYTAYIYAQRVSAGGTVQWTANGVALCPGTAYQEYPTIAADGAGGAIVAWQDGRVFMTSTHDIYAQRISAGGTVQWTANGVALCTVTSNNEEYPNIVSDGAGGAIVVWHDTRSGSFRDIYAQRISAGGTVQWTANGVALCASKATNGYRQEHTMISDGAQGAIVTWEDVSNGNCDIYTQRISAGGTVQWTAGGVALCTNANTQEGPTIAADGAGGAIVAWDDYRNSGTSSGDIYAQRVSSAGTVQWTANGVGLCTETTYQYESIITSDGAGGAIVAWQDLRNGNTDLYTQRISAGGTVQWTANGVALSTFTHGQYSPTIVSDGAGGVIAAWEDSRDYTKYGIYAQRIPADGLWVPLGAPTATPLAFSLDPVRPNPSRGGALTVHFSLPTAAPARLELLDVAGRRIATRDAGSLGVGQHTFDFGQGQHLAPGLYLVRLTQGANVRTTRAAVLR